MTFRYSLDAECGRARTGVFDLPHHRLRTPVFMPVATQGAMKGVSVEMLEELDIDIILGNTYHLGLRPGELALNHFGGIHGLQSWRRNILTDSGGFQMVSLEQLSSVTEDGVIFESTHGGEKLLLRPEDSIRIQNAIGGDIMMQLDDCIHTLSEGPRVEEATMRSIRWLDRCLAANTNPQGQCVFGIIQGCLDAKLRTVCLNEMIRRDCRGYAIGGLSGGEAKEQFWQIVALCAEILPKDKPRYCMGVGYPVDLVVCISLGVDMFDCVYPCRTARFGTALTSEGTLQLTHQRYASDDRRIDAKCTCKVCNQYTRSYLHTIAGKESTGATLLSYHNIAYLLQLTRDAGDAVRNGSFGGFVNEFLKGYYPAVDRVPTWVVNALSYSGIVIN